MANRNICLHYIVGASLGVGMQPTGLAVLEQETRGSDSWGSENRALRLRHLERLGLGASYPAAVERIGEIVDKVRADEQAAPSDVVVDVTGTGRATIPLLKDAKLSPITVTITAGSGETAGDTDDWRVSKSEMIGGLQVFFQTGRLEVARSMPLVPVFIDELQNFKLRAPVISGNDPESWREGQNDDLVFAVALAAWRASRHIPVPQAALDKWNRKLDDHYKKTASAFP